MCGSKAWRNGNWQEMLQSSQVYSLLHVRHHHKECLHPLKYNLKTQCALWTKIVFTPSTVW